MSNLFLSRLAEGKPLLADGATGTNLFALGLGAGEAPELWNLEAPDLIAKHYQSFADAGSDIILSNTFGANRYRMQLHQLEDQVHAINKAGVSIAKEVARQAGRPIIVAGSIGPTGEIMEPSGTLSFDDAVAAFTEQCQGLVDGGVDVLWIETLSATEEIRAATAAAENFDVPVVYTASIDTNGKTMMGVDAKSLVELAQDALHPSACGTNCGVGAAEVVAAIVQMQDAKQNPNLALVAKANCGIPQWVDDAIVYNGTPALMAKYTQLALDAGAQIVGGCCGTTPEHISAMREAIDNYTPQASPSLQTIEDSLGEVSQGLKNQMLGKAAPAARVTRRRGPKR